MSVAFDQIAPLGLEPFDDSEPWLLYSFPAASPPAIQLTMRGGSLILGSDGNLTTNEDCCCGPDCCTLSIRVVISGVTAGAASPGAIYNGTYDFPLCLPSSTSIVDPGNVGGIPNAPGEYRDTVGFSWDGTNGGLLLVSGSSCAYDPTQASISGQCSTLAWMNSFSLAVTVNWDTECSITFDDPPPGYGIGVAIKGTCDCAFNLPFPNTTAQGTDAANMSGVSVTLSIL